MKILNFGSLNIDYVYSVNHFVRSGETISSSKLELFCGGKGLNQSIAIARAGVPVCHAGKVGKDGCMLTNILTKSGVDISHIKMSEELCGHAIIQVDSSGQNCIMLHGGANADIGRDFIDSVLLDFEHGDILLIQNEVSNLTYLMERAYQKGMIIAFNPSPINEQTAKYPYEYIKWFILNEIEGNALSGKTDPYDIADELLRRYPGSTIVLTLGRHGVLFKNADECRSHGIYRVKAVDTTGAGDTFTGYLLAGIYAGLDTGEMLKRASLASSIAVSRKGAAESIPVADEVLNTLLDLEE